MEKLSGASVAVFGIGGVGSYCVEALVRSGIGRIDLIDDDCVCLTNINRQLIATRKTVGKPKVEVMRERMLDINPKVQGQDFQMFYSVQNADGFDLTPYDYVVDAIDTVSAKLKLVEKAHEAKIRIISCMGAGNKLDPTRFEVADIFKTSVCPLAKVMRTELRKRNIPSLKVVYSKEEVREPIETEETSCKHHCVCPPDAKRTCSIRRQVPGSISFVPAVAGLILAGEVIKDISGVR
jgi:tRNA A37 threonylcarbamoyladenosine dehydratase